MSTPQDPDFVLRRVSSGCDGRNKGMQSRGEEDDHGRVGNGKLLATRHTQVFTHSHY